MKIFEIYKEISIIDFLFILLLAIVFPGMCYEAGIKDTRVIAFLALLVFCLYLYIYNENFIIRQNKEENKNLKEKIRLLEQETDK